MNDCLEGVWTSGFTDNTYQVFKYKDDRILAWQETQGPEEWRYKYLLSTGEVKQENELLPEDIRVVFQVFKPQCKGETLERHWELQPTEAEQLVVLLLGDST